MPRYRVLRDFGSHLGNHYRGEYLTLPEGELPRGFAGFVERVKDALPAADSPPTPESGAPAGDRTPSSEPSYGDKMLRNRHATRSRRP